MQKSTVVLLLCLFVIVLASVSGNAQSESPCQRWATGVLPPFPAGFGPWSCYLIEFVGYTCGWKTCAPPDGTCNACCGGGGGGSGPGSGAPPPPPPCGYGGAPINLLTGDTFIEETDVKIPGLSNGLTLTRTWNSKVLPAGTAYEVGLFGPNWTSTYEERIFRDSNNYMRYGRADGSYWAFTGFSQLNLVSPANVVATLTADSNYTYWTVTFQNGEQRIFSYASGLLTAIIDRNGNTTALSYDGLNRLLTVTDPGGRHLYFNYPTGSYLVSSVTSDVGITVQYAYDSQNRLSQVTENDGTFVTFTYDANSNITAVKDSQGNLLESHTYDSEHRGLSSSRGSAGAESVTISYPNP